MEQKLQYFSFNRGILSRHALARGDVKRLSMSAETMTNWMPMALGPMKIRNGTEYKGSTKSNAAARLIPFVFSVASKAKIELTDLSMRVWVNDAPIVRPSVTTAITNPSFTTDLTGWTDSDDVGGTSTWATGGYMQLVGNGTAYAIRTQQVTVAGANIGVEHGLHITINRGPVVLRVGSTAGGEEYISETTLATGYHSLALTPTANFHITLKSNLQRIVLVDECRIESAGDMVVETPWLAAALGTIRTDQSGDIVFVACDGYQQYRIERRATRSWSAVQYQPNDGPFRVENVGTGQMTPSVLSGNGTLTSSVPFFRSTHVGALFAVTSTGQTVSKDMVAVNDATDSIKVIGITTDRSFTIVISGTWVGTVILERSFDNAVWTAVSGKSWTVNTTEAYTDGLDNQIVYYRLKCSAYTSGTISTKLIITTGSIRGIARVTAFSSNLVVSIEVLKSFGAITSSLIWEEGRWSAYRGYPTAVKLFEGRLWWFGRDQVVGSVSDGYSSFDHTVTGSSAPIDRTIGRGPVDVINWALALNRLVIGGQAAEYSCKSSSLDEPLTPTNFNVKMPSTQGSAAVPAVEVDSMGIFVQRGGIRVYGMTYSVETYDYAPEHLSALAPEIGDPGIVRMAVQRQPDTRVHFVRSDGTVAILVFDKVENVIAWCEYETNGLVEDVCVLPGDSGDPEDRVYYVINRTINGSTKRYIEKWAFDKDCIGGTTNKLADSFYVYSGTATTSITGLSYLEGKAVVVWADGADVGYNSSEALIYTVASGAITLTTAASNVVVGLPYTAQWKSGKLVQLETKIGTAIKHSKNIKSLGLIMADVHRKGLMFGKDFNNLDDLPSIESGYIVADGAMRTDYDTEQMVFPGTWTTDARLCLQAKAPRPVTVLAAIAEVEHHG